MHLLPAAGPRNAPLPASAWLAAAAWAELLLALAASAYFALVAWVFVDIGAIAPGDVVAPAAVQSVAVLATAGAVVVTRKAGRAASVTALIVAFTLLAGVDAYLWYG